jgi:hypothetical protein
MEPEYWACPDCGYILVRAGVTTPVRACPTCEVPLEPAPQLGSREVWWWGIALAGVLFWFIPALIAFLRWARQW